MKHYHTILIVLGSAVLGRFLPARAVDALLLLMVVALVSLMAAYFIKVRAFRKASK